MPISIKHDRPVLTKSLAFRTALWIALALFFVHAFFSHWTIRMQSRRLFERTKSETIRLSSAIKASLERDMLERERGRMQMLVQTIGQEAGIENIRLFDRHGWVYYAKYEEDVGQWVNKEEDESCRLCHRPEGALKHTTAIFKAADGHRVFRIDYPLYNEPRCQTCHDAADRINGNLVIDISMEGVDKELSQNRKSLLLMSIISLLAGIGVVSLLIAQFVHRPIFSLVEKMAEVEEGNLDVSVQVERDDEIGRLARSFNTMTARLKALYETLEERIAERTRQLEASQAQLLQSSKLASIGRLAGGVAHEINTPIGIIMMRGQDLVEEAKRLRLPEDMVEDLDVIHRQADKVAQIVRELLTFSRESPFHPEPMDVNDTVDRTIRLMDHTLSRRGIQLRTALAHDVPPTVGDATRMEQVLVNLINNAVDAMPGGGTVWIRTEHRVENGRIWAAIRVRDSGIGIPAEYLDRVFDPFFSTKEVGRGTGLGLAVSYGIVEQHGGRIFIQSAEGQGTEVLVLLPGKTV